LTTKQTSKVAPKPIAKSFQARLGRLTSPVNWVIIRVPLNVSKVWGTGGNFG